MTRRMGYGSRFRGFFGCADGRVAAAMASFPVPPGRLIAPECYLTGPSRFVNGMLP
jgi:hypothetical protein